jgi:hypothetical protein
MTSSINTGILGKKRPENQNAGHSREGKQRSEEKGKRASFRKPAHLKAG